MKWCEISGCFLLKKKDYVALSKCIKWVPTVVINAVTNAFNFSTLNPEGVLLYIIIQNWQINPN